MSVAQESSHPHTTIGDHQLTCDAIRVAASMQRALKYSQGAHARTSGRDVLEMINEFITKHGSLEALGLTQAAVDHFQVNVVSYFPWNPMDKIRHAFELRNFRLKGTPEELTKLRLAMATGFDIGEIGLTGADLDEWEALWIIIRKLSLSPEKRFHLRGLVALHQDNSSLILAYIRHLYQSLHQQSFRVRKYRYGHLERYYAPETMSQSHRTAMDGLETFMLQHMQRLPTANKNPEAQHLYTLMDGVSKQRRIHVIRAVLHWVYANLTPQVTIRLSPKAIAQLNTQYKGLLQQVRERLATVGLRTDQRSRIGDADSVIDMFAIALDMTREEQHRCWVESDGYRYSIIETIINEQMKLLPSP